MEFLEGPYVCPSKHLFPADGCNSLRALPLLRPIKVDNHNIANSDKIEVIHQQPINQSSEHP